MPRALAVTETVTVQLPPLAAIEPPPNENEVAAAVAVTVPPQVVEALLGFATTTPGGKLSVNAVPVAAAVAVLPSVTVTVDVPLIVIVAGENVLLAVIAAYAEEAANEKTILRAAANPRIGADFDREKALRCSSISAAESHCGRPAIAVVVVRQNAFTPKFGQRLATLL